MAHTPWSREHGSAAKASSGGAGLGLAKDRSCGACLRGMPSQEAKTHHVLGIGRVPRVGAPQHGAWKLVWSHLVGYSEGQ